MAVNKAGKQIKPLPSRHARPLSDMGSVPLPPAAPITLSSPNMSDLVALNATMASAKKKKKKKKTRALGDADEHDPALFAQQAQDFAAYAAAAAGGGGGHHGGYAMPVSVPSSRTGLSPELESVHLTSSASAAAAARLNAKAAAQAELLATANDLYRRMDADPSIPNPDDDHYWSSLPANIRSFVKSTYTQTSGLTGATPSLNERSKAQTMYALAQQMVQAGHIGGGGTTPGSVARMPKNGSPGYPPGAYPSLNFDPAMFSDPAFSLALDQMPLPAVKPPPPGRPPQGPLPPTNVVLHNEFGDGQHHPYDDEDVYSDDENLDEVEVEVDIGSQFTMSYDHNNSVMPDLPKKNKKKKKKKGSGVSITAVALTAPAPIPPPPPIQPTQPRAPPVVPPSSRAAGKQPMSYPPTNGTAPAPVPTTRSARAASKAPLAAHAYPHVHPHPSSPSSNASNKPPNKPRPPATGPGSSAQGQKSKIWSTNSTEERERIKEFWLGLGEGDRRALVKVEKEAVLRKMKEQQKHSCSCAVCGRKRNAIEEELEVLYDAYYDELEQYANHQQQYASSGGTIPPPPGPGPFPGSVELDKHGAVVGSPAPTVGGGYGKGTRGMPKGAVNGIRGKKQPPPPPPDEFEDEEGEDEYEDEGEEEDEDEDEYEDEEEEEEEEEEDDDGVDDDEPPGSNRGQLPGRKRGVGRGVPSSGVKPNGRDDLFNFGSSLTVTGPGNILTVADDLLKNDGQKFLEMMEQLAERRMQREEEAAQDVEPDSEDDEDLDGDVDGEDDGEEEDEDDEDDEEVMTEEQKMEEGKRMFSIFAARMFEQRVLQAYREKVAQERQLQLLRELEDEDRAKEEREAKKAQENQRKKAKKKVLKQAKEQDKAKKDAEKAAEEATLKAKQEAHEDELRKKREEERLRRETERKVREEEKARQAEEKRAQQVKQKALEAERRKEREERERKEKQAKAEKEATAKAERERERKVREDRMAKEKEDERLRKEKAEKAEKEKEERRKADLAAANAAAAAARAQAQAQAAAAKASPVSPRGGPSNSSFTHSQQQPQQPKKILANPNNMGNNSPANKPPIAGPSTPRQPPIMQHRPPPIQSMQAQQPQRPIQPLQPPHLPPQSIPFPHPPHSPMAISPRTPFMPPPPPPGSYGPIGTFPIPMGMANHVHHGMSGPTGMGVGPQTPGVGVIGGPNSLLPSPMGPSGGAPGGLAPSALPRGYGGPGAMDYPNGVNGFEAMRSPSLPTPIGPPSKQPSISGNSGIGFNSVTSPGGHSRRSSTQTPVPNFGAVQRPIGRPVAAAGSGTSSSTTAGGSTGDESGSTSRRTPSPNVSVLPSASTSSSGLPEGVLGSRALMAEDDEPILPPPSRRTTASTTWGESPVGTPGPFGQSVGGSAGVIGSGGHGVIGNNGSGLGVIGGGPGVIGGNAVGAGAGRGAANWSMPRTSNASWPPAPGPGSVGVGGNPAWNPVVGGFPGQVPHPGHGAGSGSGLLPPLFGPPFHTQASPTRD